MRVSQLSERSGVPLSSIKFYIREGLLPPGRKTSPNQAAYDEQHVRRLALIRALREDVALPIESIARALRVVEASGGSVGPDALDALERPMGPTDPDLDPESYERARRLLLDLVQREGWPMQESDASVKNAARALAVISRVFSDQTEGTLLPYIRLMGPLAAHEVPEGFLDRAFSEGSKEDALRYAMLGTLLFEPFLLALRRMAHLARIRTSERAAEPESSPATDRTERTPRGGDDSESG